MCIYKYHENINNRKKCVDIAPYHGNVFVWANKIFSASEAIRTQIFNINEKYSHIEIDRESIWENRIFQRK